MNETIRITFSQSQLLPCPTTLPTTRKPLPVSMLCEGNGWKDLPAGTPYRSFGGRPAGFEPAALPALALIISRRSFAVVPLAKRV